MAMLEIVGVVHVSIGFSLEGDVEVGAAGEWQADEPLKEVAEVEAHDEQLQHLSGVDALMAEELCADVDAPAAKQDAADVDGVEAAERKQAVVNDLHA